jgi:hypothetical protein
MYTVSMGTASWCSTSRLTTPKARDREIRPARSSTTLTPTMVERCCGPLPSVLCPHALLSTSGTNFSQVSRYQNSPHPHGLTSPSPTGMELSAMRCTIYVLQMLKILSLNYVCTRLFEVRKSRPFLGTKVKCQRDRETPIMEGGPRVCTIAQLVHPDRDGGAS